MASFAESLGPGESSKTLLVGTPRTPHGSQSLTAFSFCIDRAAYTFTLVVGSPSL